MKFWLKLHSIRIEVGSWFMAMEFMDGDGFYDMSTFTGLFKAKVFF